MLNQEQISQKRPLTAAEKVTYNLRLAILSGELVAGSQIRQEEVATRYQVSRMPVREAFRQLEAQGLLEVYPNQGAYVTVLSEQEIREIYELRILLETEAVRRAVPAFTAIVAIQADALIQQSELVEDSAQFAELDQAFHTKIYQPTERPRLLDLINTHRNQVTRLYYQVTEVDQIRSYFVSDHRRILDACKSGDIDAAVVAVQVHLERSVDEIISSRNLSANQEYKSE